MSQVAAVQANPFVLLVDPQAILQAVERSDRLAGLSSRICRPLDRPLIPTKDGGDVEAFDREVELDDETDTVDEAAA